VLHQGAGVYVIYGNDIVFCKVVFQAIVGPFLARFGSLGLRRKIQARYYDAS
jgi:hypothetical protein